jgi:hypothetical protein
MEREEKASRFVQGLNNPSLVASSVSSKLGDTFSFVSRPAGVSLEELHNSMTTTERQKHTRPLAAGIFRSLNILHTNVSILTIMQQPMLVTVLPPCLSDRLLQLMFADLQKHQCMLCHRVTLMV